MGALQHEIDVNVRQTLRHKFDDVRSINVKPPERNNLSWRPYFLKGIEVAIGNVQLRLSSGMAQAMQPFLNLQNCKESLFKVQPNVFAV